MNTYIKLILLANDPDPMKIKIALINGRLPEMIFDGPDNMQEFFTWMTGIDPQWIPFSRKVNFFVHADVISCVYAIILPEEQNLLHGNWVAARDITHDLLPATDFEIFKTALGTI